MSGKKKDVKNDTKVQVIELLITDVSSTETNWKWNVIIKHYERVFYKVVHIQLRIKWRQNDTCTISLRENLEMSLTPFTFLLCGVKQPMGSPREET